MKCPRQEILFFTFVGKHICIRIKGPKSEKRGRGSDPIGFMLALDCVKCMDYYIITLQLLYLVYVILKFCTNVTNVNSLFTISKCFSVLTTLLISSNPLTRVEGDALVFNQVEGAFG